MVNKKRCEDLSMTGGHSLGPAVEAVWICANIIQLHLGLGLLGVRLEEDGLPVAAFRARMILRPETKPC